MGLILVSAAPAPTLASGVGPSVRDVVEFTRIIEPAGQDADVLRSQVSPDGTRVFIVTRRSDVASDRNIFELLLLDVTPERLAAGRTSQPRRLVTVEATQDEDQNSPFLRDVRWVGNQTLVFRARMGDGAWQVYKVDATSGQLTQLTHETRPIVSYAVSDDLSRVLYVVHLPNPPMAPGQHHIVVANQSFWSVKFGQKDTRSQHWVYQYVTAAAGVPGSVRALSAPFPESSAHEPGISLSPDGRWALLPRYEPARQAEWAQRYPLIGEIVGRLGWARDADPLGYYSRPTSYTVRRLVAYRLADGYEQPVLDAPDDALNGVGQVRSDRLWFDRGRSVVIAGAHLPVQGEQKSTRSHVVEYWPDENRWKVIAELEGRLDSALHVPGSGDGFVTIEGPRRRYFGRDAAGAWREVSGPSMAGASPEAPRMANTTLRIAQSPNVPPDVVADVAGGATVQLTNLNPRYSAGTWGVMQPYAWHDADGNRWEGGLMAANGEAVAGPRPLVIQTYGFSPSRFYLDGANAYDGYTSGFAGRAFLPHGVLVLAMPWRPAAGPAQDPRVNLVLFEKGVRTAVDALVKEGRVDPTRVGILGWSATGQQVLNLITFSGMPIRAATLIDGDANTLFALTITYGATDTMWSRNFRINRGLPFGDGLENWLRYDPALHTDCVRSAVRIETYGPWVLTNWDIYALLRRQYKPAEMIVIPGGTHALSRPAQRMISLQGNVDWYRFWLKGEERDEVLLPGEDRMSLRAQYVRWREMAELKRVDDARPVCRALARR